MSKSQGKITTGTKEWCDSNINIFSGCSNNCVYCYAKKMAIRFGRKTNETWPEMELNYEKYIKNYGKRKGRIMFPSTHDITKDTLACCIHVLRKIVMAGNEVLITTKPDPFCVKMICETLGSYRPQIQFRFTITSRNNKVLRKWEPGAPLFMDRFKALLHACVNMWKTSISIEPFLDLDPIPLIKTVASFVSESIWVGKLNYQKTDFNTLENIQKVINNIKQLPCEIRAKIRFKDSIKNLCEKNNVGLI
ncbi:MAG: hypothetical protein ACFFAS_20360 [Promethearchaeota archaeon]